MPIKFKRYSDMGKELRDKTNFLNIKRLALRIEKNSTLNGIFYPYSNYSHLFFALRYFDIENEAGECLFNYNHLHERWEQRDVTSGLSDFLCSLYEQDRGFFQSIISFILKEGKGSYRKDDIESISQELQLLGYSYDGEILKTVSGNPLTEQKIKSVLEDSLGKIKPELVQMRQGAIEALLSNMPDKARYVSSSSRALITTLLKELTPDINAKEGESEIKLRVQKIFGSSDSTKELIDETIDLIQALNRVQAKGDHNSLNDELAFFIFEITEKLVYFILISSKQK